MTSNQNKPAFATPTVYHDALGGAEYGKKGLTKKEYLAAHIVQGLLAHYGLEYFVTNEALSVTVLDIADCILQRSSQEGA